MEAISFLILGNSTCVEMACFNSSKIGGVVRTDINFGVI